MADPLPADAKPLTFGSAMVRAILDGRKTQTRRLFTPGNCRIDGKMGTSAMALWRALDWPRASLRQEGAPYLSVPCNLGFAATVTPRWRPGDRLYVREATAPTATGRWRYAADGGAPPPGMRWRAPRYMPAVAARALLTVEAVRIQRLQEISPDDAAAEGLWMAPEGERDAGFWFASPERTPREVWGEGTVECFERLWNHLYGPGAWNADPWVIALTFTVQKRTPGA